MSSTESRAAEATAWQRAVLDELGAPPAGLARLSSRGAGPRRPGPAAPPELPTEERPSLGISPEPPTEGPAYSATPTVEVPVFSPHPATERPAFSPVPAAEATTFDPPPRVPRVSPEETTVSMGADRPLPDAERTVFDPRSAQPPAQGRPPARHQRPAPHEPPAQRPATGQYPSADSAPSFPGPARRDATSQPTAAHNRNAPRIPPPPRTSGFPHQPQAGPHPEALLRRSRHGDPMLRRVARELRKVTGASQDGYQDTTLAEAIQQPVTTGRRIAVTSIRGGAGKSVVSALMSTALAHFRQDRVLAVDADPGIGSLMLRLGMTSAPSMRHLADGRISAASFDAVRQYLAQTDAGVWALGGTDDRFGQVNLEGYRTATNLLSRFFGVTVTDCGAGLTGELHEGILAETHSQVMVTPATPDGAISARRALEMLATSHNELAARTTVVFVTHAAGAGIDLDRAVSTIPSWCPRVEHLAFDRHLADGSVIDPARLAEPTRVSALRIAVAALSLAAGRSLPQ